MAMVNQITLPQEIIDRVMRVFEYHRSTKLTPQNRHAEIPMPDLANQPDDVRVFEMKPKVPLPQGLLDMPTATLPLMSDGFEVTTALMSAPPQDLKTLATWLQFA